jgi:hypothetical protein
MGTITDYGFDGVNRRGRMGMRRDSREQHDGYRRTSDKLNSGSDEVRT